MSEKTAGVTRSAAELEGLLAVAEHRLHCSEIRAAGAERRWAEMVEAFNRLAEQHQRVWDELVPADVKQRIEADALARKERDKQQLDELMRDLGVRDA